jgi:hypothetical protein
VRTFAYVDFTIEFGGEPQDVTITTSGVADTAGCLGLYTRLASDPRHRRGLLILADHSTLDTSELTDLDIERIAAAVSTSEWHAPPRAVAILVASPRAVDQARLAIAHMGGSRSNRRVFTSHAEAVAWLREQR